MEEWRPVVGFESRYAVSNLGRVRRVGHAKGARPGLILIPVKGGKRGQYRRVQLGKPGPKKYVHVLVAEAFLEPAPSAKYEVNHKDGDTLNNKDTNLEWLTRPQNMTHAYRVLGRKAHPQIGESQWNSRFTEVDILEMRRLWDSKQYSQKQIADLFSTKQTTVSRIVRGEAWRHLPTAPLAN